MGRVFKVVKVLFLLAMLWMIIFFSQFITSESLNTNTHFIPEDAELALVFDGKQLMEQLTNDFALTKQEDQLFSEILNLFESDEDSKDNLGIDFLSNIVLFTLDTNGHHLQGALLNLSNSSNFDANVPSLLSENSTLLSLENVGLILQEKGIIKGTRITTGELDQLAERILSQPTGHFSSNNEEILLKYRMNGRWIDVKQEGNTIAIEGYINYREMHQSIPEIMNYRVLRNNGNVHLSTHIIPQVVDDQLRSLLGDSLPAIRSISVNLYGMELVNADKIMLVPDCDVLLYFGQPINFKDFLKNTTQEDLIGDVTEKTFTFNDVQFQYTQLSDSSVYFGQRVYSPEDIIKHARVLEASGSPSLITDVQGSALLTGGLNMIPLFSASKQLSKDIEHFEMTITSLDSTTGTLKASIEFKEDTSPLSGITRFLLNSDLLD